MNKRMNSMNRTVSAVRIAAFTLVALLACLLGMWRVSAHAKEPLTVLMYHHIVEDGKTCNDMTITVSRMEKDLRWLKDHGCHTVLPRELADGDPLPKNPVLLTFDDGYRSNYELLYPLLQKYQMKAVISIIVMMPDVGADNFLSWDMCREMAGSGLVEIGSHSYGLHNLGDLGGNFDPDGVNGIQRKPDESDDDFKIRVLDDIQKSHDLIEKEVGQKDTFFAYPFGVKEPDAEEFVDNLFPVTAITKSKIADLHKGLHDLPRVTVTMNRDLSSIFKKLR